MSAVEETEESSGSSTTNNDEFEDAQDELRPLPERSALKTNVGRIHLLQRDVIHGETGVNNFVLNQQLLASNHGSPTSSENDGATDRRYRLDALRNRMTNEFGTSYSILNISGNNADDDGGSASESTSLASWGRNLLTQTPYAKAKLIYPTDTISTKAFSNNQNQINGTESSTSRTCNSDEKKLLDPLSLPPTHRSPPSIPKSAAYSELTVCGVKLTPSYGVPPPLPPRKLSGRLPNALSAQQVDLLIGKKVSSTKELEEEKSDINYASSSSNELENALKKGVISLANGFARMRGHVKTNSLDRGLSLAKSMKTGPFPPRSNKSNSLKREYTVDSPCSSSYLSFDEGEEDLRNSDARGVIRQITSSILNESLKEESLTSESPTCYFPSESLSSVGEDVVISSKNLSSKRSNSNENEEADHKFKISVPKLFGSSNMDSGTSSKNCIIENHAELLSSEQFLKGGDAVSITQAEYSDPITRDVERRMSMKGHQQISKEAERDNLSNVTNPSNNIGRAAGFVKGYGNYASELFRGAFLRAKSAVSSGSPSKLSKEDEESCNESDHEESSVAEGTPVVRPKNSKKGPFDFDGTRCFQELNNEHTGAVWCMKFSLCGRLLATAGQDNIIRVWVLRNHLSYFNALRDRYNSQSKKYSKTVNESLVQNPMQDIENDLHSSSTTLRESTGSSLPHDDDGNAEAATLMASKPLCTYRSHTADILDLSWSRNYFILSSGMDRTVKLWHLSRPECLCCFQHMDFVTCIAFMPKDDRYFLSGSLDGKLRLWHIPDKKVALWNEVEQVKFITAIAFAKNGKFAVVGTYDGRCFFYTTDQLKYHTVINVRSSRGKNSRGHKVTGLAVHGDKLLVTSNDSRIRMYDLRDMALTCKFKGAQNERSQIRASFSPDGKHIVCGSEDRFIYVWTTTDLPSSLAVRRDRNDSWQRLRGHSACVTVAIFAPRPQLFLNLLEQRRSADDRAEQARVSKNMPDRQIHGDVIISADLNGSIRIFVNRTKIKAGSSNFFPTD